MIGVARRRTLGAAAHAFVPTSIAGLKLWFKADGSLWQDTGRTTPAVADGDPVGTWDDSSVSANNATQATAGKRPLLKLSILNTKPVVRFDGVDDLLATSVMTLAQPLTYLFTAVERTDPASSVGILDSKYDGTAGTAPFAAYNFIDGATNKFEIYAGATIVGPVLTNATAFTGDNVFNNASSSIRKDGGAAITGAAGNAKAPSGLTMGGAANATQFANYDLAEVLIYDSVLSNANMDLVGGYLASKYGLTWTPVV